MIGTKCPGQDMRYWTAEDVYEENCPQCGELIEFFKTDIRLRCPNCKTRVANPRFNMGCAEWCAYAEQCLGPGAKGLKSQSLKVMLEDQLKQKASHLPEEQEKISRTIEEAEKSCKELKLDMFPVIASIVAVSMKDLGLIEDEIEFINELSSEITLPQAAVKDSHQVINCLLTGDHEEPQVKIVADLLKRMHSDI